MCGVAEAGAFGMSASHVWLPTVALELPCVASHSQGEGFRNKLSEVTVRILTRALEYTALQGQCSIY